MDKYSAPRKLKSVLEIVAWIFICNSFKKQLKGEIKISQILKDGGGPALMKPLVKGSVYIIMCLLVSGVDSYATAFFTLCWFSFESISGTIQ